MEKRKIIRIIFMVLTLVITVFIFINHGVISNKRVTDTVKNNDLIATITPTQSDEDGTLTLKEAIDLAYPEALKWSKNAKLVSIWSADPNNEYMESGEVWGQNGKRDRWNMYFSTTDPFPKGNDYQEFLVSIIGGKIEEADPVENDLTNKLFSKDDLRLDSSDALKIAIDKKGIKPEEDWAMGYHFRLEYGSFYDYHPDEEILILQVYGQSPNGNWAYVAFDEKSGKIIESEEKIVDADGNATWTPF